jgi:hypothetical protein
VGRLVRWLALGAQLLLALSVAKQWLFVGTYRFYLDGRSVSPGAIAARASQRFDVVRGRVEPQILTPDVDRLSFPVAYSWPSRLEVRAVPVGQATVEIAVVERASPSRIAPFPDGARDITPPASCYRPGRARQRGRPGGRTPGRAADGA